MPRPAAATDTVPVAYKQGITLSIWFKDAPRESKTGISFLTCPA
jgi:hypothetical protein